MANESDRPSGKWWYPFRWLGQIAGALSILNLIRDLQWISLKGVLEVWVVAYDRIVKGLANFLFGWIDISWMTFSETEAHLFVVGILLASSWLRASDFSGPRGGFDEMVANIFATGIFWVLGVVLGLLIPGWPGDLTMLIYVIAIAILASIEAGHGYRKKVTTNIGVAVGLVAATVVASEIIGLV